MPRCEQIRNLLYQWWEYKNHIATLQNSLDSSSESQTELPQDMVILCSYKNLYMNSWCPKNGDNPHIINKWNDKQNVVYLNNGILFGNKKDDVMLHAITWLELENMPSERN